MRFLNRAITEVETYYEECHINQTTPRHDLMLEWALKLTKSKLGLIAYYKISADTGNEFLEVVAVSDDNPGNSQMQELIGMVPMDRPDEPTAMETQFAVALRTKKACISNESDEGTGKNPKGLQMITCFLVLPLRMARKSLGVIGLANRVGGYTEDVIDYVSPFVSVCGNQIAIAKLDETTRRLHTEMMAREMLNKSIGWMSDIADRMHCETSMKAICDIANEALFEYLGPCVSVVITILIVGDTHLLTYRGELGPDFELGSLLCKLIDADFSLNSSTIMHAGDLEWEGNAQYLVSHSIIDGSEEFPPVHVFRLLGATDIDILQQTFVVGESMSQFLSALGQAYLLEHTTRVQLEKKAALDACQMKAAFLATMSHEIRTPLNGILGIMDLLKDSVATEYQQGLINAVLQSSESLSLILNDILELSKLESHNAELEMTDFQMTAIIENLKWTYSPAADKKTIQLNFVVSDSVPTELRSDQTRVTRVLGNLVSNAIKFTQHGHVTVEVDFNQCSKQICVHVSDTGVGITSDQATHLFQSFKQVEGTISRKYGGTGLGLVLAKKLTDLLEGTLSLLKSEYGVGSTFEFTFPYHPCTQSIVVDAPVKPKKYVDWTKLKVLVADDNSVNQKLMKMFLNDMGVVNVHFVCNGAWAVESAISYPFDLILMDLHMPVMDGFESTSAILRHFKKLSRDPPAIVAITADDFEATKKRCSEARMTGVITKPFRKATFQKHVTSILDA